MLVTLVTTQSNKGSSDVDAISPFYGLVYPESKISCTMQTIPTAKKFKSIKFPNLMDRVVVMLGIGRNDKDLLGYD